MASKSLSFKLTGDTREADVKLTDTQEKLKRLTDRVYSTKLDVDDKAGIIKLKEFALQADRINKRIIRPNVSTESIDRADLALDKLSLKMESVGDKSVSIGARVRKGGIGGILSSLVSKNALQGLLTGTAGTSGGLADFGLSPAGLGVAGASLPILASLLDALTGFGIGTGVAGAGVLGVKHFNPAVLAPGMTNIDKTLSSVFQSIGPSVGMMFAQLGKFTQGQAPNLAKLFGASLPFMKSFMLLAEQAAKTILPAFTQAMNQMVKSGALKQIMQGLASLTTSLAMFVRAIGPGFKAGAETFRAIMIALGGTIAFLGYEFGKLGAEAGILYGRIRSAFDSIRHTVATDFDTLRHDIASAWDAIFQSTIGTLGRMATAAISDVSHLVSGAVSWFRRLPGMIVSALASIPGMLFRVGANALHALLGGLESALGPIISFAQHVASIIGGILGGIGSAASSIGGAAARVIPHAAGGIISEPIIGRGLRTGAIHTFGENGLREMVTPLGSSGSHSGGATVVQNIYVADGVNPDMAALRVVQELRKYKTRHGNVSLGLG